MLTITSHSSGFLLPSNTTNMGEVVWCGISWFGGSFSRHDVDKASNSSPDRRDRLSRKIHRVTPLSIGFEFEVISRQAKVTYIGVVSVILDQTCVHAYLTRCCRCPSICQAFHLSPASVPVPGEAWCFAVIVSRRLVGGKKAAVIQAALCSLWWMLH